MIRRFSLWILILLFASTAIAQDYSSSKGSSTAIAQNFNSSQESSTVIAQDSKSGVNATTPGMNSTTAIVSTASPIPVELFAGHSRFVISFSIARKFTDKTRFGFLASSYMAVDYGNDKTNNESMNVALLSYEVLKGLNIVAGAALHSAWGFRPFSGLQYQLWAGDFSATATSGFYLTESHNFETKGFIEYKPKLSENWSLLTRAEGQYNISMETDRHDRSRIYARLGLTFKTVGFGLAANWDWYGPLKNNKENFGIFVRKAFR